MRRTLAEIKETIGPVAIFVRERRKLAGLTQEELAARCGVGPRFLKELERGKASLRMDKVLEVLQFFGHALGPVALPEDER
jgi:y4mF family transcriptional regulator